MRRTEPTAEETERLTALDERLKPLGFSASFHCQSPKGSERPFRLSRHRSYLRYFETVDAFEAWVTRIFDTYERVDRLNVQLKMFDVNAKARTEWSGNKPYFVLEAREKDWSGKDRMREFGRYYTIEGLHTVCHKLIRVQQAKAAAE